MHAFILAPLSFLLISLTDAQNSTVNSTIAGLAAQTPPCVDTCGGAAILKVGCGITDYICQCQHFVQLNQLIPPCLNTNSTCSAADITKFETISVQICAALGINVTVPTNLPISGGAATTTGTATTSAMTMATTGSASRSAPAQVTSTAGAMILDVNKLAMGGYAVVGAGLLGFFL